MQLHCTSKTEVMAVQIVLVLSFLAVVMSDQVTTIPPGYALQNYLCSGLLKSDTTVLLDEGEHHISSGISCRTYDKGNITIMGVSTRSTTVRCEEDEGFWFSSVQNLTIAVITFIQCELKLESSKNTHIANCTFQTCSILSENNVFMYITRCVFKNYSGDTVRVYGLTGNVSITSCTFQNDIAYNSHGLSLRIISGNIDISNCTFQNNHTISFGGAVMLFGIVGNVSISDCTFQNNSAYDGGAVAIQRTIGNINITGCTFQNNSAYVSSPSGAHPYDGGSGGAISVITLDGNVCITDCTFQNNSATDGGAVQLNSVTGNINVTNCTFQNNHAAQMGGALLVIHLLGNSSITKCTFQMNSVDNFGGAVCIVTAEVGFLGFEINIEIAHSVFQTNNAIFGGAVGLNELMGNINITNCTFQNNSCNAPSGEIVPPSDRDNVIISGGGGAVSMMELSGNINITSCTFQKNNALSETAGGGAVKLSKITTGNVIISNCSFSSNFATLGGGALVLNQSSNISITGCIFQSNSVSYGGGGGIELDGLTGDVSITKCTFQNNTADYGGAIFVISEKSISINASTFNNNIAVKGAAIYATNKNFLYYYRLRLAAEGLGHLLLQDVAVKDNHCSCNEFNETRGGAVYFSGMTVDIFGSSITGSDFSYNSPQGAIDGEDGYLQLHGNIVFSNNIGENGGAISLSNNVPLYFFLMCRVEFSRNFATGFGGAIYNDGIQKKSILSTSNCIICFVCDYTPDRYATTNISFSITFIDNYAQQGGHAVYATPIYNCMLLFGPYFIPASKPVCDHMFANMTNVSNYVTTAPSLDTQILSFPAYVYLCRCSDPNLCNVTSQYQGKVTTYPGRTVRLNVTSLDYESNLSPSVIYTQIDTTGIVSKTIMLGPRQKAQWIGTVCGPIEYQIYGPELASLKLLLSTYPGSYPTVIEVELLPCEPGFTLVSNTSTGMTKCDCSLFFTSHGVLCDTSDGTVARDKTNWIGVYNKTLPAMTSFCPVDYCNSAINKLSLAKPGDLCNGGRTGILCGHCYGNNSVIFGSSKCQVCTDMLLITLVMFAVLGVLLVAALFFLNLTVTQGTLYGLIFYANIIQINTGLFLSQSKLRPFQVIVSFVNLDLGLPLCFYDGMDDADKAGLQFVFPAYLLILTMTVIVLCHYCLQRSPTTSSRSCCYRFPIIIGERAVGVLSTLIYLSYSKLLRTVIDVYTYSTVYLPTGDTCMSGSMMEMWNTFMGNMLFCFWLPW